MIYSRPERQKDITQIKQVLRNGFSSETVLEIAAGTGFWTSVISETASSILAIDYNDEVLDIAKMKNYGSCNVKFQKADAYNLSFLKQQFSAGFAGFWWSHIPLQNIYSFLKNFKYPLINNAVIIFLDNKYVEGNSTPISRKDSEGNTYQQRILNNGSTYEVLKNFPEKEELYKKLSLEFSNVEIEFMDYFWIAKCHKKDSSI